MNRLMRQADQLVEVARRTFDTPEFRGITFIGAEAKLSSITPGNAVQQDDQPVWRLLARVQERCATERCG